MTAASGLYADHVKIYPQRVRGRFRSVKWAALAALLAIYYATPWIRWQRGPGAPDQAVLVDLPGRRAYFFSIEIWPQDVPLLAGALVLAAIGLFLATAYAGRLWCGFACPQTVWTDLYLLAERWTEGDRNARMRLDAAPWDASKAARKLAKHAIWLAIAFATGGAWVLYFKDAPTVAREFFVGQSSSAVYGFAGLFTATTYLLAGWAREQVCTYMCPWPRFQSAMFDEDTLTVTYRTWRGEPRGKKPKAGEGWEGRGDCVDCHACVNACPTGVDIREGIQLECIGCGLCIDACDAIMDRVGRPRGLIAFDTEARTAAAAAGRQPAPVRLLRLRPAIYAMMLAGVASAMAVFLLGRGSLDVAVLHDRGPLYVTLSNGDIRNDYTVKVQNRERAARPLELELVRGPDGARLRLESGASGRYVTLAASPDGTEGHRLHVRVPRESAPSGSAPLALRLTDPATGESRVYETFFQGPGP